MGSWKKPDPELLPIHRPRCPKCQMRMITTAICDGPEGFEHRTFKCLKCAHTDERALASDPSYSAAQLLLAALRHGVNPHTMPHLGVHDDGQPGTGCQPPGRACR